MSDERKGGTGPGGWVEYEQNHPDIQHAKAIEPYFTLFRLFGMQSRALVSLTLAAIYTLARKTDGLFTRDDMDRELSYLSRKTRSRTIRAMEEYGWIMTNGISYEIPERAKTLLVFLFGALTRPDIGYGQDIRVAFAMVNLDEAAGTTEETAAANFDVAIHTLKTVRAQLKRVLEQRSSIEAKKMLDRSAHVRQAVADVRRHLRDRNRIYYRYGATTETLALCSEIETLFGDLLLFIHTDVQAHARSFGQYLSPEQVEEFLQTADVDLLASLSRRRFSSPRSPLFVPKDDLLHRGLAFLQQEPEDNEPSPDPPVVDVQRREVVVHRQEGPAQQYYRELMARLRREGELTLNVAVIKGGWGETLFRTGLLTGIHRELAEQPDRPGFNIHLDGRIQELTDGPVVKMTRGKVEMAQAIDADEEA